MMTRVVAYCILTLGEYSCSMMSVHISSITFSSHVLGSFLRRLQKPKIFGGWKIIFKHCPGKNCLTQRILAC